MVNSGILQILFQDFFMLFDNRLPHYPSLKEKFYYQQYCQYKKKAFLIEKIPPSILCVLNLHLIIAGGNYENKKKHYPHKTHIERKSDQAFLKLCKQSSLNSQNGYDLV